MFLRLGRLWSRPSVFWREIVTYVRTYVQFINYYYYYYYTYDHVTRTYTVIFQFQSTTAGRDNGWQRAKYLLGMQLNQTFYTHK